MTQVPVCFLNLDSINVTPYFSMYEQLLHSKYDLIYWDRSENDEETTAANVYRYSHPVRKASKSLNFRDLFTGYLGFRQFAKKILTNNDYKLVIALTGNVAVLLGAVLKKKYKRKYIMDIRDYFLEDIPLYKKVEQSVIDSAALALISSPSFTSFLGEHDFKVIHNVQNIKPTDTNTIRGRQHKCKPFVLANIGTAKTLDLDIETIKYFANDERFELRYIGRGFEVLNKFCKENSIWNVKASGDFPSAQTIEFYRDLDGILSLFGNEKTNFKHCLPNKLYYAAQLMLPIFVTPDTYMSEVVKEFSLGFSLDLKDRSVKEEILNSYEPNVLAERKRGAGRFMAMVESQNKETYAAISRVISGCL